MSADPELLVGTVVWSVGDFFHYEENLSNPYGFPDTVTPVVVGGAPPPDTTYRLVRVLVDGVIGGRALVENIDYSVDYANMSILRITAWDSVVNVPVSYVFLAIGNVSTTAPSISTGDTDLTVGGQDPAAVRAVYDPARVDWMGQAQPSDNHQDLSLVDRSLMLTIT